MTKESGWWSLATTTEPNDTDLERIADLVRQGFTSGEICQDEDLEEEDDE